jgi:hypothetical protein
MNAALYFSIEAGGQAQMIDFQHRKLVQEGFVALHDMASRALSSHDYAALAAGTALSMNVSARSLEGYCSPVVRIVSFDPRSASSIRMQALHKGRRTH